MSASRELIDGFADEALVALVDVAPDGLMVLSEHGEIIFVNKAGAKLLAGSPDELTGSYFGVPLTIDGATEITIPPLKPDENLGICQLRVDHA